jgi:hypothetical protein
MDKELISRHAHGGPRLRVRVNTQSVRPAENCLSSQRLFDDTGDSPEAAAGAESGQIRKGLICLFSLGILKSSSKWFTMINRRGSAGGRAFPDMDAEEGVLPYVAGE